MKKLLFIFTVLCFSVCSVFAQEQYLHPIDRQENTCKANAKTLEDLTKCTYLASREWNKEVDKYYSLLYKKLPEANKTTLFDDQKYWNMYKNNEIRLLNALYNKDFETKERLLFRTEQKRDIVKYRAESLRMYYIMTFSDDDKEKLQVNSEYHPDNIIIRGLRYLGF